MTNQKELVERVKQENEEYRQLFEEHKALDQQLDEFSKRRYLTSDQEIERKNMQKQKLLKKDRMVAILREYKQG